MVAIILIYFVYFPVKCQKIVKNALYKLLKTQLFQLKTMVISLSCSYFDNKKLAESLK